MKRAILGIVLLLATACSSSTGSSTNAPLRVETWVVEPRVDVNAGTYVGVIEAENSAALSFPVAGTLTRVFVNDGDRVRKGDLLAQLDPVSARQTFEAAKATLQQARDASQRLQQLYEANSLPEIQWIETQTRLRQAEAAYGIAEKNLHDCDLYAPFSGVVGQKRMSVGETAMPGLPVMTLLEIGQVKVRFSVPELEIATMTPESRVRVVVPALGDSLFVARALEKGAVANPAAHTYDVRAALINGTGKLLPGMVCRVSVTPASAVEQIAVPVRAVEQTGNGNRYVWRVQGDSAVRTTVRTGRFADNDVVILEGLKPGDRIVVDGMQKIGQGSKVVL